MNLKETYNRIANDWYKDHKEDDWWIEGTKSFVALLKPGATVLDVGCGAGFKSKYLHENGLNVTGIDFSEKFIEIAKRDVLEVNFIVMDMNEVGRLNQKYDAVFAQASLLHVPKSDASNMIGKFVDLINKGGYLYIAVKGIKQNGKEEEVIEEKDYGYPYERFFSFYTMEELVGYFKAQKLKIVYQNEKIVGRTNWLQIIGQRI